MTTTTCATTITSPSFSLTPFGVGWSDGFSHYKWMPSRPLSISYMEGYISGWLAKGR